MTAPTIPPTGHNPASPRQRQAARDHVTQLRQHGWTYRSIAAATALSPNTRTPDIERYFTQCAGGV